MADQPTDQQPPPGFYWNPDANNGVGGWSPIPAGPAGGVSAGAPGQPNDPNINSPGFPNQSGNPNARPPGVYTGPFPNQYGPTAGTPPPAPAPPGPTGAPGPSFGNVLAPFTEPFAPPANTPYPTQPTFTAPTFDQALNDPGYKFAAQQGEQALQQGQAAQGVGNTGGSLKDILAWGQNYAAQRYGDVFNRAQTSFQDLLQPWQTNMAATQRGNEFAQQAAYNKWIADYNIYRNQKLDTWNIVNQYAPAP